MMCVVVVETVILDIKKILFIMNNYKTNIFINYYKLY